MSSWSLGGWYGAPVAICIGAAVIADHSTAFTAVSVLKRQIQPCRRQELSPAQMYVPFHPSRLSTRLYAAKGKKKRRRRRKNPPSTDTSPAPIVEDSSEVDDDDPEDFDDSDDTFMGLFEEKDAGETFVLPDIRDAKQRKKEREEQEAMALANEVNRVKISRSDKKALRELMEVEPYADADPSYFEEEEYDTVDAILGERAKPFLGIASGPLQVGHFVGALGIILMAYIEYPGFPLTNLPTPIRDCLQTGLFTVYAINAVLAVLAGFKAAERDLSVPLWALKTFSVGGLAYDQLTQLPIPSKGERKK